MQTDGKFKIVFIDASTKYKQNVLQFDTNKNPSPFYNNEV